MAHARTQVQDAVIARLLAEVSALKGVFSMGRSARAFDKRDLPIALIAVDDTIVNISSSVPRKQRRDLSVQVHLLGSGDDTNIDNVLNDLSVDVEKALANEADVFGFRVLSWAHQGGTPGTYESAEAVYARLTLIWTMSVLTTEGRPDELAV